MIVYCPVRHPGLLCRKKRKAGQARSHSWPFRIEGGTSLEERDARRELDFVCKDAAALVGACGAQRQFGSSVAGTSLRTRSLCAGEVEERESPGGERPQHSVVLASACTGSSAQ
eukprot:3822748-Pleurochrysis_carterae.AAC.1